DRAAFELFSQQSPNITEDRAVGLLQECAKLAAKYLADALADYLERETVAAKARNQRVPLLRAARQLLVGQQSLPLDAAQTAELQHGAPRPEHPQFRRRLAAGYQQAALVASLSYGL